MKIAMGPVLLLSILVVTGCDSSGAERTAHTTPPPASATFSTAPSPRSHLPVGSTGRLKIGVHCGLQYVELDGRAWKSEVRYDKASRGPGIWNRLKPDTRENLEVAVTRPQDDRVDLQVDPAFTDGGPVKTVLRRATEGMPGCA